MESVLNHVGIIKLCSEVDVVSKFSYIVVNKIITALAPWPNTSSTRSRVRRDSDGIVGLMKGTAWATGRTRID